MPSVVYGPGKREGERATLPPRPTSIWECLADLADKMDVHQLRRVAMLLLRVVCAWRLEDIGRAFDLHKGHVSRETERARTEIAAALQDAGITAPSDTVRTGNMVPIRVWLDPAEVDALRASAAAMGLSLSGRARSLLLLTSLFQEPSQDATEAAELSTGSEAAEGGSESRDVDAEGL